MSEEAKKKSASRRARKTTKELLYARIANVSGLCILTELLNKLANEFEICATATGMQIQLMGASRVSLIDVAIEAGKMERYRCQKQEVLGISSTSLLKILKCGSNVEWIELRYYEGGNTIELRFSSSQRFDLTLLNIETDRLESRDVEPQVHIALDQKGIAELCKWIQNTIGSADGKQAMEVHPLNNNEVMAVLKTDAYTAFYPFVNNEDDCSQEVEVKGDVPSFLFGTQHLLHIKTLGRLCKRLQLHLAQDLPLEVLGSLEDLGTVKYFLAPQETTEECIEDELRLRKEEIQEMRSQERASAGERKRKREMEQKSPSESADEEPTQRDTGRQRDRPLKKRRREHPTEPLPMDASDVSPTSKSEIGKSGKRRKVKQIPDEEEEG